MKFSVAEFGKYLNPPLTRMRVNQLVTKGELFRGDDRKIDTAHPTNAAWIDSRKYTAAMPKSGGRKPAGDKPPGNKPPRDISPPPLVIASQLTDEAEINDVLTRLVNARDIRTMSMVDVQKIHRIETALKVRVEREHKRRELIERSLVRTVFGKLWQVDTNELRTLGGKLAPDLAGLMGIDDPVISLMIEQRIDGEILKSLNHIKRIIDDFLVSVGSEAVEQAAA
jgi:hypothetical protein